MSNKLDLKLETSIYEGKKFYSAGHQADAAVAVLVVPGDRSFDPFSIWKQKISILILCR